MRGSEMHRLDQQICGAIWTSPHASRLMEKLGYDIGPRPPGSQAMGRGLDCVGEALEQLRARRVHTESVPILAWREAPCQVDLLAPYRRSYQALHHVHTGAGQVRAPLLDAGAGATGDLKRLGARIGGSVLLVRGHEIAGGKFEPLPARVRQAIELGAAGVLVMSMYPGTGPAIELMGVDRALPVPVLGLAHEDAVELAAFARRGGARVHLAAAGTSRRARCANLVAEIGPARRPAEEIILSAHLDCFHVSPGALDNLTGVVTLVEMARALAPLRARFRRRLRLVVFTGEEYGLKGSQAYVRQHADELDPVRFVFNMDSLFPATAAGVAVMWAPAMRDYVDRALAQTQCRVDVRDHFCMSSDYLPFMLEGIAAARPADWTGDFPPWSHTFFDTPDKVPDQWIRQNAMAFAQLLMRLLVDPRPLPARRKSRSQVQDLLGREDAADALRPFGFQV